MKKILFFLIFLIPFLIVAQTGKKKILLNTKQNYYLWDAVTGSNLITDTDVFLYGSFTKDKTTKLLGSKSASKYININMGGYYYQSSFLSSVDGWSGLGTNLSYNKTFNGVDGCLLSTGGIGNPKVNKSITVETVDSFFFSFDYRASDNGAQVNAFVYNDDWGNYQMSSTNLPISNGWATFDTIVTLASYIGNGDDNGAGAQSFQPHDINISIGSGSDSLYVKNIEFINYSQDSVRTLARTISLTDLIPDKIYTYYCSTIDADGRYSKGADSTFTTPLQPITLDVNVDTFLVALTISDFPLVYQALTWYKDGVIQDSIIYGEIGHYTTVYDSGVGEGHYYKAKLYGHYASPFLTDSVFAEPIIPYLSAPTNLYAISDTTGIKLTWQDNSLTEDGFIIRRSLASTEGENLPNIDTVSANIVSYCDSLPNINANTDYKYQIYAFEGIYGNVSNIDTATAYYDIASSSIVSIDSSITDIDTIAGISFSPDLLGIMDGNSLADFSLRPASDNGHTKLVSGGWYVVAFDSGTSSQETNYMQKTFTGQSDSIFAGFVIKADGDIRMYSTGDEHMYYSIYDTVQSRVVAGFGIDDGTGSDGIADRWALQYWNNGALVSNDFSANGFTDDSCRLSIKVIIGNGTGQVTFYVNDAVIDTFNTLTNNTVTANAIRIGNDASAPYGSDYAKKETFRYDKIYVDSRYNQTGDWWNSSTTYDTTWGNYDTTFSYVLIEFNCADDEPPTPPDTVTGLDTTLVTSSSALLVWDDVLSENGYYIQRKLGNQTATNFANIGNTTVNDTTYTDDTASDSTWYTYRVYAYNGGGNGGYSDTLRIFTDDIIESVDPPESGVYSDTLYVSASATGSGTGQTVGSPYTIYQALNTANPGNLILASAGIYNLNAQDIDITRAGTYGNPIELRGVVDASDSAGLTYSANSTTFVVTVDQNNDSAPMFEVFAPYNTIKNIVMVNDATGQAGWGRIDADAYCTILDGVNFKQTHLTTGSIHSWRVYADSVIVRNSYFNRGSRCIIWFETNGDGNNTIRTALVEGNVFTGAFDHGAIQFMPNTGTTNPNWLEDVTVRNNIFIDNPYDWNLHFRYFRRANVYNNLFIRSGSIYTNDRHYPNDTDSLNSEGSLFVYNTVIDGDGYMAINRQMNEIVFANNLVMFSSTPAYLYRFTNLAVGEDPFNQRHFFDYNFVDLASGSVSSVISSWNTASDTYINVNWTEWKALGFDNHTVIDIPATFLNTTYYQPLSVSSPQVGKGIPITTANGFRIDITTDAFGNTRSATNPTCGWAE